MRSLTALALAVVASVADPRLVVLEPVHRVIQHTSALFGFPKYGSSVTGRLYYANDGCKSTDVSPLLKDLMGGAFLVLVDRGGCPFSQKVRLADKAGAEAVIVADNRDEDSGGLLVMKDEAATDIVIPSVFVSRKDGAGLAKLFQSGKKVLVQIDWKHRGGNNAKVAAAQGLTAEQLAVTKGAAVQWELWGTTFDRKYSEFSSGKKAGASLQTLATISRALGGAALFSPKFFAVRGSEWYQGGRLWKCDQKPFNAAKPACGSWCTNQGRYCVPDPDGDVHRGLDGADILQENLRQMCLFRALRRTFGGGPRRAPAAGVQKWWQYVSAFSQQCDGQDPDYSAACSRRAMGSVAAGGKGKGKAKQLLALVASCVAKSGGAAMSGGENALIEADIRAMRVEGVMGPPKLVVDGVLYQGRLDCPAPLRLKTCGVLGSICAAIPRARRAKVRACSERYWSGEAPPKRLGAGAQSYTARHHLSAARARAAKQRHQQHQLHGLQPGHGGGATGAGVGAAGHAPKYMWPALAGGFVCLALLVGCRSGSSEKMLYSPVPGGAEVGMTPF